ncbi:MAG: hypothetical protein MJZ19_03210 [Paludibacteraceae bacterium]|nr:hypothetical protein [Paludibacteraceae bacterium]
MRNGFGIIIGLWVLALGGYIYWQNSTNATESYVGEDAEDKRFAEKIAAKKVQDKYIPDEDKYKIRDIGAPDTEILEIAQNREWTAVQIVYDGGAYVYGKARYLGQGNYEIMRNDVDSVPVNVKRGMMKAEFGNLEGPIIVSRVLIAYCYPDHYIKVEIQKGMTTWEEDKFGNIDKRTITIGITREVTKETYCK